MSGLQFDWRKRGADMQKLHPTQTPLAEADAIQNAADTTYDVPALPSVEAANYMQANMLSRIAKTLAPTPFSVAMSHAGLAVNTPAAYLQTLHNSTPYSMSVYISSDDGSTKGRLFILQPGTPITALGMFYAQRIYVRKLYTTSGPVSSGAVTVGGTPAAGQVYTFSLVDDNGIPSTISYTAIGGDTNSTIATQLASLAAANTNINAVLTVTPSGAVVNFVAKNAGSLANLYAFNSLSATGSGTLTPTAFSGAAAPEIILAGTYA